MTMDKDPVRSRDQGVLTYLVYTSVAARKMLPADLESILFTSRRRNLETGITGALLYRNTTFIQFLEGPPAEIEALMDRIRADDRHSSVRVLLVERASERSFGDWKMGFGIPQDTRTTGIEGVRDSFTDLTDGAGYDVVRQAAEDFSIWFKVKHRALPS